MLNGIAGNAVLSVALTSSSMSAIYRQFTYIVAVAIWTLETLFDLHTSENQTAIFNQKSGRLSWYRTMALKFQYGFDLVTDHDYFDNTGFTDEQIKASKIIKYAAVNEAVQSSRVILKIAGESEGVLSPISEEQREAFDAYINEIKWAGVKVTTINYLPDRLFLSIQIKRDALVLNEQGMSRANGNYPIIEAIQQFMRQLPFDGELRLSALVDRLQVVEGVKDATIISAASSWINPVQNDYGNPVNFNISATPESGYYEVVTYENISYVV